MYALNGLLISLSDGRLIRNVRHDVAGRNLRVEVRKQWRRRRRAQAAQGARADGRAQEEEHFGGQQPPLHPEVLQAADLLQPLQRLHLVSRLKQREVRSNE